MYPRLQDEIKQTNPFQSLEEEVLLNLMRTADALVREVTLALKPWALTPSQYNVLRILRGAGSIGLTCGDIGERMVARDPDITRLLDRLEKRGMISRCRKSNDRRVITTRITPAALEVLAEIDEMVPKLEKEALGHMNHEQLESLIALLHQVRQKS